MDFFAAQELARKRTQWMIVLFALAVSAIAVSIYGVLVFFTGNVLQESNGTLTTVSYWQPQLFFTTFMGVILFVGCCSLFKMSQLRSGGSYVAKSVGGQLVNRNTQDPDERKLMNIVEEMSIASGVPCPDVFILPEEGINAFAAGFSPDDAAVAVTRGCIATLNRDELQGVIAHEFSHILNGDMRMNIRLMGILFGILALSVIGQLAFRSTMYANVGGRRRSKEGGGAIMAIMLIGLAVMVIGYIGMFFGRWIQSAISRQREFLADASAIQFTRNPDGIGGALKKIGGSAFGGEIKNPHSQETAHLFFANSIKSSFVNVFATHPPLPDRIRAIDPNWNGEFSTATPRKRKVKPQAPSPPPKDSRDFISEIGQLSAVAILQGQAIHEKVKQDLQRLNTSTDSAKATVLALQVTASPVSDDSGQLKLIKSRIDGAVYREVETWMGRLRELDLNERFALLDSALPRSVETDLVALKDYPRLMTELANLDGQINLEELALVRVVTSYVQNRKQPNRSVRALSPQKLEMPICVMLSALAHATNRDSIVAEKVFKEGAKKCNRYLLHEAVLLDEASITLPAIEAALELFSNLPLPQKKTIFEGALAAVLYDGKVEQQELNLIRIIAASMQLPMPPLVAV